MEEEDITAEDLDQDKVLEYLFVDKVLERTSEKYHGLDSCLSSQWLTSLKPGANFVRKSYRENMCVKPHSLFAWTRRDFTVSVRVMTQLGFEV